MKPEDFIPPNKDRLNDLNERLIQAQARKLRAMQELDNAKRTMRPLVEALTTAEAEEMNIACRIDIFWDAYRNANHS